jgi:hypothetical protein
MTGAAAQGLAGHASAGAPAPDLRLAHWLALLLPVAALALTLGAPLWLLLAGPLLLGVPHVAADLRYLVLRPGLHRRRALWLCAGPPLLYCCARPTLWAGCLAALAALACANTTVARRALPGAVFLALLLAGLCWQRQADLLFAHLHNLLALGFAGAFWPGGRRRLLLPLAAVAAGAGVLLLIPLPADPASLSGLTLGSLRASLAPGLDLASATRLVLLYGFLQAAHYAAWLAVIPAAQAGGGSTLRGDLGWPLLALCLLFTVALAGWALADAAAARTGYLRFAGFHGHLELAAAALWLAEGRAGRSAPNPAYTSAPPRRPAAAAT